MAVNATSAPKLDFVGASETIITVAFPPVKSSSAPVSSYELCWKEYPQNWDEHGQRLSVPVTSPLVTSGTAQGKIRVSATDLNPNTTYTVRLIVLYGDSERSKPGPDLIIDTDAVSCTPERKCIIL
uniref:Fibronectin type-III domain-containing protein n=1 Tax=Proboscia inermis TaxID=420281 RepID=A0A6T8J7H8_9STRA|mmetsp:Transcript_28277/g.28645  ORF Transcript_28277/g.28645 Transcript_28277/m.28645 type:complete len:126 (+) Transcript_28277:119-496(+)